MSRIGKKPVDIPNGVTVEIQGNVVTVKGPKGTLNRTFHKNMLIELKENQIIVSKKDETPLSKSLFGLTRTLLSNMVEGVTKGFFKKLEIIGVGYRAQANKNKITLTLGFSHPVEYTAPEGIEFLMDPDNKGLLTISGIDKQVVGEVAAKVRSFRKPEPYKGKGIKYLDEKIVRKAGKSAVKAGA